jgi:hypothetical protein
MDMTKKQKPKAEAKPSRSRSLAPRSEHPAKAVMRELLAARQEDRAARQVMAEQIAELKALVISGQTPVLPTAIADYTRMLNAKQFCEVLKDCDENRFYTRTDRITVGGVQLVNGDVVRLDYPEEFDETIFEEIRAKSAEPIKLPEPRKRKAIPDLSGTELHDKSARGG